MSIATEPHRYSAYRLFEDQVRGSEELEDDLDSWEREIHAPQGRSE